MKTYHPAGLWPDKFSPDCRKQPVGNRILFLLLLLQNVFDPFGCCWIHRFIPFPLFVQFWLTQPRLWTSVSNPLSLRDMRNGNNCLFGCAWQELKPTYFQNATLLLLMKMMPSFVETNQETRARYKKEIAEEMGLSLRTFQRRLDEANIEVPRGLICPEKQKEILNELGWLGKW